MAFCWRVPNTFVSFFRKIEFKDSDEEEEEVDDEDDDDDGDVVKVSRSSRRHKKGTTSKAKKHSKSQKRKNVTTTSDEDDGDGASVKTRDKSSKSKPVLKRDELTTVNMDELTDLFSKPKVYFAKKSHPDETSPHVEVESPSRPQSYKTETQVT